MVVTCTGPKIKKKILHRLSSKSEEQLDTVFSVDFIQLKLLCGKHLQIERANDMSF